MLQLYRQLFRDRQDESVRFRIQLPSRAHGQLLLIVSHATSEYGRLRPYRIFMPTMSRIDLHL